MELPYVNTAYAKYKDNIEILALNPFDSNNQINFIKGYYRLGFPTASCEYKLATTFGVTSYPTTVIIDKYGVIRQIEVGAITSDKYWDGLFVKYLKVRRRDAWHRYGNMGN